MADAVRVQKAVAAVGHRAGEHRGLWECAMDAHAEGVGHFAGTEGPLESGGGHQDDRRHQGTRRRVSGATIFRASTGTIHNSLRSHRPVWSR